MNYFAFVLSNLYFLGSVCLSVFFLLGTVLCILTSMGRYIPDNILPVAHRRTVGRFLVV